MQWCVCVCTYTCVYLRMHVYMHACMCMHDACMCLCMYACMMRVCVYACMHACVCVCVCGSDTMALLICEEGTFLGKPAPNYMYLIRVVQRKIMQWWHNHGPWLMAMKGYPTPWMKDGACKPDEGYTTWRSSPTAVGGQEQRREEWRVGKGMSTVHENPPTLESLSDILLILPM